jgi:hypothetical protein
MDLWSAWLVLTHHYLFMDFNSPFTRTVREKESKLTFFLKLSLACRIDLLCCLELFSNSHPLSQPLLTRTSLPPNCHKNLLILVDSSLPVFLKSALRLLASDKKDQPPRPVILKTIWYEWTRSRWSPLALCNMSLEYTEISLIKLGYLLFKRNPRKLVQPSLCTFCPLHCVLDLIEHFCCLFISIDSLSEQYWLCALSWYWKCIPGILIS